jgi:hypothetical protein
MAQKARFLHITSLEKIAIDEQSSLLGSLVNYKESEVLGIWSLMPYITFLIELAYFITYPYIFVQVFQWNSTLLKCRQLFECQHLLLLRDIWWSKF